MFRQILLAIENEHNRDLLTFVYRQSFNTLSVIVQHIHLGSNDEGHNTGRRFRDTFVSSDEKCFETAYADL